MGLRLNRGIDLAEIANEFGQQAVGDYSGAVDELVEAGLLEPVGNGLRLTARGRLLSNEVFERFISTPAHV